MLSGKCIVSNLCVTFKSSSGNPWSPREGREGREGRVGVSDRPEANQTVIMTRPFITLLLINDNIQKRDNFRNSHKNTRLHQNNASAWQRLYRKLKCSLHPSVRVSLAPESRANMTGGDDQKKENNMETASGEQHLQNLAASVSPDIAS